VVKGWNAKSKETRGTLGEHVTEKLKAEIRKKYDIKTYIIGTAACKMAMQLDLHERVREEIRETHTREQMENKQDSKQRCWEEQQVHFAKPLLYGGQGEQCKYCHLLIMMLQHPTTTLGARTHHHLGPRVQPRHWIRQT
jgi:hypothetical protein